LAETKARGIIYLIITIFLWSTIEVVSKPLNKEIDPEWIAFLRFFIGGLSLFPLMLLSWKKVDWNQVRPVNWSLLVLLSFVGITATFTLFHIALVEIGASSAATLISTVPLFIAPLSFIFLKERISWVGIIGILLGTVGIMVIVLVEGIHFRTISSPILILIAVICFSIYSVCMKPINRLINPRVSTPISLTLGAVMMLPFLLFDGASIDIIGLSPESIILMLYLSIVAVGVAYLLFFLGLEILDVSKGASFFYLKPIIATSLAFIFLKEYPSEDILVAIVLISISIYLVVAEVGIKRFISSLSKRKGQ
jgi:drug/metabolite transporter (DMT)-like permease